MSIKQTILILVLIISTGFVLPSQTVSAATCAGVNTSIIQCEESSCPKNDDGSSYDPFEGENPLGNLAKVASYKIQYGHTYGLCKNGATPSAEIKDTGIWGILLLIINILTAGIGVVAVGGLVYGSILYASAGGGPEQVKKAKTIITDVVIGLVAYALMFAFLNFIIPGGLFA